MTENAAEIRKAELIERLIPELPALRACLGLSQAELAVKLDISRQSIVAIENHKRKMSWDTYLAVMFFFMSNEPTRKLLYERQLFTAELAEFLHVEAPRIA